MLAKKNQFFYVSSLKTKAYPDLFLRETKSCISLLQQTKMGLNIFTEVKMSIYSSFFIGGFTFKVIE